MNGAAVADEAAPTPTLGPSTPAPASPVASAQEPPADDADAFPIDAFIIPEDADHLPAGVDSAPAPHATPLSKKLMQPLPEDRAARLADRLEAIARRLRADGPAALGKDLESHDRFDALLAGVLAGYLAAGDE
ncbi:MAG TPA: hypothetical protein VF212_16710 [Longimicrobiales bacterium]